MSRKEEKINMEMNDDVRKTVKNNRSKKSNNKKNLIKKIIIIIVLLLIIVSIFLIIKNRKVKVKQEEIKQYNYFLLSENDKTGIINKEGNIVINPEYEYIQIPNPEKAIFVCLYDYNSETQTYSSKVIDDKGKVLYSNYEGIMAISSNNTSIDWGYQTSILKYKNNDKYGIITTSGKKVTNAIYDSIETLSYKDGVLKVSQDGKYGLISLNGEKILNAEYNSITTDGYYNKDTKYENAGYIVNIKTDNGYRYGYIDYLGKVILECKYNSIKRITEIKNDKTAYLIAFENGQAGVYKNVQNVIKNEYDSIEYDKVNQILALERKGKYGVYDLYGNMILPIQYDEITFAGNIITANKDGKSLVFDPNGNIKKDYNYKSIMPTDSSNYYISIDNNEKYGIMDNNGNVLVNNEYSYIEYTFDKYFIVTKSGKAGMIDNTGKQVLENKYDIVQNINGTNIIQAIDSNSKISEIYNKNITKVLEIENARIYMKEEYIKILSLNDRVYLDFDGNKKEAKDVLNNNKIFAQKKDGKWGYVDVNENKVLEFIYDFATDINEYGYGAIRKDDKWGVIDSEGKIIKEPIYKINEIEPVFVGQFYKESTDYKVDSYTNKLE